MKTKAPASSEARSTQLGKRVGDLLNELRPNASEREAAERLGIGVHLYRDLESGRRIPLPSQRASFSRYVYNWVDQRSARSSFIRIWSGLAGAWGWAPIGAAEWERQALADGIVFRPEGRDLVSDWQSVSTSGTPRVRFVDGDHGAGKSTLVNGFLSEVVSANPDVAVAVVACAEHSDGGAYNPMREILADLVGHRVGPNLTGRNISLMLGDMLYKAPVWRSSILNGFERAARATPKPEQEVRAATHLEKEIIGQYLQLLRYLVGIPTILFFDDLQQADPSSCNLLLQLVRLASVERYPLYLIAAFRTFEAHAVGAHETPFRNFHREAVLAPRVHPTRLSDGIDVGDFLVKRYAGCELPHAIREYAEAATRGNPWLLHEIFTELDKLGNPRRTQGDQLARLMHDWQDSLRRFMTSVPEDKAPEDPAELTLKQLRDRIGSSILEMRLSQLDRASMRDLLNRASVEWKVGGKGFTVEVLTKALEMTEAYVYMHLSELEHNYLLVRAHPRSPAEAEEFTLYEFWYWLYGSYIYEQVPPGYRPKLHRNIAECLEVLYAGSPAISGILARHYAKGNEAAKAAWYALSFARLQAVQSAWATVEHWCNLGLTWAESLTEQDAGKSRLELLYELGQCYYLNGDYSKASGAFQKAIEVAPMTEADPQLQGRLWAYLAESEEADGEYGKARKVVKHGEAYLKKQGVIGGEVWLWLGTLAGLLMSDGGKGEAAVSMLRKVIAEGEGLSEGAFTDFVAVRAYNCLAIALSRLDLYTESTAYFRRALAVAERLGDHSWVSLIKSNLAEDDVYLHRFDEAEALLREAVEDATRVQDLGMKAWACGVLGNMFLEMHRPDEAVRWLKDAAGLLEELGTHRSEPAVYADLALAHLELGECDVALAIARHSRQWAASHVARAYWLDALAQIEVRCSRPPEQAKLHFEEAIALLDKTHSSHFGARSRRRLAHLLTRLGEPERAKELLEAALVTFRSIDLPYEVELTEKLLQSLDGS